MLKVGKCGNPKVCMPGPNDLHREKERERESAGRPGASPEQPHKTQKTSQLEKASGSLFWFMIGNKVFKIGDSVITDPRQTNTRHDKH